MAESLADLIRQVSFYQSGGKPEGQRDVDKLDRLVGTGMNAVKTYQDIQDRGMSRNKMTLELEKLADEAIDRQMGRASVGSLTTPEGGLSPDATLGQGKDWATIQATQALGRQRDMGAQQYYYIDPVNRTVSDTQQPGFIKVKPDTAATIATQPAREAAAVDKSFETERFRNEEDIRKNRPIAQISVNEAISNLDRMKEEASAILNDPSLSGATGMSSLVLPKIYGTRSRAVAARIQTLKNQIGFAALQAMRNASKTGGALGQVAIQEIDFLQNSIAALDKGQPDDVFPQRLQQVIDFIDSSKRRLQEGFQNTYGGGAMQSQPAQAQPMAPRQGRTSSGISYTVEP